VRDGLRTMAGSLNRFPQQPDSTARRGE